MVLLRTCCRLVLPLVAAAGVVLTPAKAPLSGTAPPAGESVAQSPVPPAVIPPVAAAHSEPLPEWNGPTLVPTAMPVGFSAVAASEPSRDAVAVPEPSVILLLLGGAGVAMIIRRPRMSF